MLVLLLLSATTLTLTPASASLSLSSATPSLKTTLHPASASLTITAATPTVVSSGNLLPSASSLIFTSSSPALKTTEFPSAASLSLTAATPRKALGLNPVAASLSFSAATPVKRLGLHPAIQSLSFSAVTSSLKTTVRPSASSLSFSTFTPTVASGNNKLPSAATLTLTPATPTLFLQFRASPATAALSLVASSPALQKTVHPAAASITITSFSPTIAIGSTKQPAASSLSISGGNAALRLTIRPGSAGLTITGALAHLDSKIPGTATLVISTSTPHVQITADTSEEALEQDLWAQQMALILDIAAQIFGHPSVYMRPGFEPVTITAIPEFLDRLEDVSTGQFYSLFYRLTDFNTEPFNARVTVTFSGPPHDGDTITLGSITYTSVSTLDPSTPYQFLRGSSSYGAAANLTLCINADPGGTAFYSTSTTANPDCTAEWNELSTLGQVTVSARVPGIGGNSLMAQDEMFACTIDSSLFYGGLPLVNDLITFENILWRVSDVPQPDPEGSMQIRIEKKAT